MKIKIKKSKWSSKKYDLILNKRYRKKFKRNYLIFSKIIIPNKPSYFNKSLPNKIISTKENLLFPKNIKDTLKLLEEIKKYKDFYKITIDLKILSSIDNISILILTANINEILNNFKLKRKKTKIPKKEIDDRLRIIGFWNALCVNPPQETEHSNFLKIKKLDDEKMDNNFHSDIINFFTEKHNIGLKYKDSLFDAVYEACANSFEHAYEDSNQKKIWFLGSYNESRNELEFIFYDIGIGVFESLKLGKTKVAKIMNKFAEYFGKDQALIKLCTTKLSRYKGKDDKRGNGMIAFKDFIDEIQSERKANLEIVVENLLYSTSDGKITRIPSSIRGTLIRWTVGGFHGEA